jgi:hypothetical protein
MKRTSLYLGLAASAIATVALGGIRLIAQQEGPGPFPPNGQPQFGNNNNNNNNNNSNPNNRGQNGPNPNGPYDSARNNFPQGNPTPYPNVGQTFGPSWPNQPPNFPSPPIFQPVPSWNNSYTIPPANPGYPGLPQAPEGNFEQMQERAKMEQKIRQWVGTIRSAESEEAEKIEAKSKLKEAMLERFQKEQKQRKEKVEQLEEQLAKLKKQIEKREESFPKLVDLRIQLIEQDSEGDMPELSITPPMIPPTLVPNPFPTSNFPPQIHYINPPQIHYFNPPTGNVGIGSNPLLGVPGALPQNPQNYSQPNGSPSNPALQPKKLKQKPSDIRPDTGTGSDIKPDAEKN